MSEPALKLEDLIVLWQINQQGHAEGSNAGPFDRLFADCLIQLHDYITEHIPEKAEAGQ